MYTLLTGLYRELTRKEEFYVIILGLDNAGKTTASDPSPIQKSRPAPSIDSRVFTSFAYIDSPITAGCGTITQTLLEKIKSLFTGLPGMAPEKIAPTVGLNIGKIDTGHSRINFWDLGGQRELHSLWDKYYTECHAILFVVDATDQGRLEEVKTTFEGVITNDHIEGVPILMLANKQDMDEALKVHEIKELFNPVAVKLGARDSKVLPVSALKGDGIQEAVDWLLLRLQRNKTNRPPVYRD
ncbi:P-loop containing nucleoside triphosphate hydrolase protein [Polychytrium aggregatum]|uniref:P-loop containing nucleoside triphosphate hydrolase protein n=1 Tax=Polychytrium aggregatum TaxID=110093 RepID=UPI0022FE1E3F|nr:P-loop containing nucleoside triphosphate hydrolase protein [Polychytrium aggregatum]KAI9197442.1 P-loop containing nucleoside triphosphate hydrolase protein [Polychytrium aggregatum]